MYMPGAPTHTRSPGISSIDGRELPCGSWEQTWVLEEQSAFLTVELTLSALPFFLPLPLSSLFKIYFLVMCDLAVFMHVHHIHA